MLPDAGVPAIGFPVGISAGLIHPTHQFFNLINDLEERRGIYIAALRLFSAFPRTYR
jgi:hypothetical protein